MPNGSKGKSRKSKSGKSKGFVDEVEDVAEGAAERTTNVINDAEDWLAWLLELIERPLSIVFTVSWVLIFGLVMYLMITYNSNSTEPLVVWGADSNLHAYTQSVPGINNGNPRITVPGTMSISEASFEANDELDLEHMDFFTRTWTDFWTGVALTVSALRFWHFVGMFMKKGLRNLSSISYQADGDMLDNVFLVSIGSLFLYHVIGLHVAQMSATRWVYFTELHQYQYQVEGTVVPLYNPVGVIQPSYLIILFTLFITVLVKKYLWKRIHLNRVTSDRAMWHNAQACHARLKEEEPPEYSKESAF